MDLVFRILLGIGNGNERVFFIAERLCGLLVLRQLPSTV